jgi:hypothetical protein
MPPAQSPATRRPRPALVTNVPAALSHQRDFAKAFVGLLGHPAIGDTFHITSDEWLSWNEIFRIVAHAVRVEANLVHVPPDAIAAADPKWGAGLLGNEGHWMISTTPRFVGGPPFRGGHPVTTPGILAESPRPTRIPQIPRHELPLELQSSDEEEDRQEPVCRPLTNGQIQTQLRGTEVCVPKRPLRVGPRRVRPHHRHDRRREQQRPTDRLQA